MSDFEFTHGAYADAVDVDEVALLPSGWRDRLLKLETQSLITNDGKQAVAYCLHPNDIVVSKLSAGREGKDDVYCRALIRSRIPELDMESIVEGLKDVKSRRPDKTVNASVGEALVRSEYARLSSLSIDEEEVPPRSA